MRKRVRESGATALAVLDLIPPPFPFTIFVLAAGSLSVNASKFFVTLAVCRLLRFGGEALLAVFYGPQILAWLQSDTLEELVSVLIILAVVASIASLIHVVRRTRTEHSRRRNAA